MKTNPATKTVVMVFGLFLAMAGLEHGIGEIWQGNVVPEGIVIKSWGDSPLFDILAGEPAMTLVPNLLLSGILSIGVSLVIIIWCLFFLARRHSGLILMLLSVALLLVGGGFAPPLIGLIIGLGGMKNHSEFRWLRRWKTRSWFKAIARVWPMVTIIGSLCFLYLFPVSIILWGAFGLYSVDLIAGTALFAFAMIAVSLISAYFHDAADR